MTVTDLSLYRDRRARLLSQLEQGVMLVPAAPTAMRNGDVEHPYRQDSDLRYLTGFEEAHSLLLLCTAHAEHHSVLFLQERDAGAERWDGARLGVEAAVHALGIDAAFPIGELQERLPDYLAGHRALHLRLGRDAALDAMVLSAVARLRRRSRAGRTAPSRIIDPSETVHEMRLIKDAAECASMRRAGALSAQAHRRVLEILRPGLFEYEVEAEFVASCTRGGSPRQAYEAIVASGPGAGVLHYRGRGRQLQPGELLLLDAGCELEGYAADITRTLPASGRFSAEQRAVYEVVLAAQKAAIAAVKPGSTLDAVHDAAVQVITEGLRALGLISGSLEACRDKQSYKRFFMHRTSHWLGMDVHDVGGYFVDGKARTLEAGMVCTVEPGLYLPAADDVPARWHDIAVRIEDDVIVTEQGVADVYTEAAPKEIAAIEACMQESACTRDER
ncbi:MAG: aminopeptidase P N-terminal domain-containing protein [Polyangiales bacterium]